MREIDRPQSSIYPLFFLNTLFPVTSNEMCVFVFFFYDVGAVWEGVRGNPAFGCKKYLTYTSV